MKIGILIKDFNRLSNSELRVVNSIINDSYLELSLLIKDGRNDKGGLKAKKNKIKHLLQSGNILGRLLLKIQILIEKKIFTGQLTVNKRYIIRELNKIKTIELFPERRGFSDIFNDRECKRVKDFNLDVILKYEFSTIKGSLLNAAKYGIWAFCYGKISTESLAGFRETLLKQKSVAVILQQLIPDGAKTIDKALFNRHWSFIKTNRLVLEASVSVLLKNIKRLQEGNYNQDDLPVCCNRNYKHPEFLDVIRYAFGFYKMLIVKLIERINMKMFGARYVCWTLFIGEGNFLDSSLFKLKPVNLPKNEFWADPFIINYKNENYVFFENYNYKQKKGKISCGIIRNKQLEGITDVLNLDYHLSYPYVFKENGEIFLMPETSNNNRLELYRCISFPDKWELYSTAFEGEKVGEAFFYNDDTNQKWLFINKQADSNTTMDSELFIYRVNDLRMNNMEAHKQNPVIINSEKARNAGCIFKYKDSLYRPSQSNIDGIYGRALNINKIEKLTIDEYLEKNIITIFPDFEKNLIATHHLHQSNNMFLIDAAYKKR